MHSSFTATQLRYRCQAYISTEAQRNEMHLKDTSLQYRNAVVSAETAIRPLQHTATQMH